MATVTISLPPLHDGQREVAQDESRFKVLACGRRWGKTKLCSLLANVTALEGGVTWWVAPTYDVAKIGWRMITALADQIPGTQIRLADREITYPTGGRITQRSADGKKSLRGEGIDRLIMEEAAQIPRDAWYADLRPALSDTQGGAIFIGTPNGRNNLFYDLYVKGQAGIDGFQAWQRSTYENPYVPDEEIDAAKVELPEWYFNQEYLADFATFAGRVFKSFDPAGPAVFHDQPVLARYDEFFGGIDFGFKNPTACIIAGRDKDGTVDCIDQIYERRLLKSELITLIEDMTERYNVGYWWADPSEPDTIAEMQANGLPVYPAPKELTNAERWVKSGIIEVEKMLVGGWLRFYHDGVPDLIRELDVYRYPETREGFPEKEMPLKVDDHSVDAVRYLVCGLYDLYASEPRIRMLA